MLRSRRRHQVLTRGRFGTFTRVTASPERAPAPSPASQKPTVSILRPVMALVVAGIAVGTLLLWVLDPSADDGAAPFVAMAGVPMLVSALTVQLVVGHLVAGRRLRLTFLWWLFAVLPLALLLAAVPAVLADPDYFGSSTVGGTLGVLGMLAVLALLGYGFGALLWFFVVMPLAHLGRSAVQVVRGERPSAAAFVMPLVLLSLAAVILLGSGALDLGDTLPGRFSWPQILMALLGIPGDYRVESEAALWVVRGLVVGIALVFVVPWWRARAERRAAARSAR